MKAQINLVIALILLGLCFGLAACAPDPRNQADADAVRIQAEQDAADRVAERARREAADAIRLSEQKAESQQWIESWNGFVRWSMLFLTVGVCAVIMASSAGASWAIVGSGRAASQAAWVRANLIGIDRETRQFPLYIHHLGQGRFTLTDMNTGMVQPLDIRVPADRQLIAAAGAVRLSGAVAAEARRAKDSDSAGVAIVGTHPVVIGAQDGALKVGEEINHG